MIRALYSAVIWLHPPAFRRLYGDEMIWIFDQAPAPALLLDALRSLARQWILRGESWKVAAALSLAILQVIGGIAFMLTVLPRPVRRIAAGPPVDHWAGLAGINGTTQQPITLGIMIVLGVAIVAGLSVFLIILTTWTRGFSQKRRKVLLRGRPCSNYAR